MKKFPFVKQESYKDCGAASLFMIIKYYKGYIPLEKLYELTSTTKNGTSAYHILKAAESIGFKGYGMKKEISHIKENNIILPAIAHVMIDQTYPHFVVIYKIDALKNKIWIADPAEKLKVMSISDFNKIFTKKLIILYPTHKIPKEQLPTKKIFKRMIKENQKMIISVLFFMNLSLIISLINLYHLTNILTTQKVFSLMITTFILMTTKVVLNMVKDHLILKTSHRITKNWTNEIFQNILLLPYQYYKDHTTGDVMTRMNDLNEIRNLITLFILIINDGLLILASGILLSLIHINLFLIVCFTSILYFIYSLYFNHKIIKQYELMKRKKEGLNSYMTEAVFGFESIKGLNLEKNFIERFQEKNEQYFKIQQSYEKAMIKLDHLKAYLSDINLLFIIGLGLFLVHQKTLSLNELFLFYMVFSYFFEPINNLLELDLSMQNSKLSFIRILQLSSSRKKKSKPIEHGPLKWDNANIYVDDKPILKKMNFNINPKDKIMLFGKSGTGKSTILKMMKQYYISNHLYVNGKDYNQLDFKNRIAYISQNEYLFTGTLYDNIVFNRKIEIEQLNHIIEICSIHEIIAKNTLGLYMLIEENGFNLSGGEKQRIILARALVSNFDYLLIDEGLSQVDISMERKIIKQLLKHYHDKTIIFVSHRLDNLDLFDKALKVENDVQVLPKNKGGVLCFENYYR